MLFTKGYSREIRILWIKTRRNANAIARRLGFRNYAEWQGDND